MSQPLVVNLPHQLGKDEAKRRIAGGMDKLANHLPGQAKVTSSWEGDRLNLQISAMGQDVASHIDVEDKLVHVEVLLPALLGMFGHQIANFLTRKGGELLEDKRNK